MSPVRAEMHYVYVLRDASNGKFYTGYTADLRKRMAEHDEKRTRYTSHRGPYELFYYEASRDSEDAKAREKYLKSGMGKRYLKNSAKRFLALTG